jgi:hypothetical protein
MLTDFLRKLALAEEQLLIVIAINEAIGHPDIENDRKALVRIRALRHLLKA